MGWIREGRGREAGNSQKESKWWGRESWEGVGEDWEENDWWKQGDGGGN